MMTAAKRDLHPAGCGGEGCDAKDPWPLHHLRHRGNLCRFCTSCVLKCHPGSFCCSCFDILDSPPPPNRPIVHCSKCSSVSHLSCLPNPELAPQFLCPICKNPDGFSFFALGGGSEENSSDGRRRSIDLSSAKVLLAAATLAAASMSRAAAVARSEAERKVKEASLAKKRAREMLERAITVSKKEKEKVLEAIESALVSVSAEGVEPKKKVLKPGSAMVTAVAAQKRVQSREREKWMRFHEPIQVVHPPIHGVVENDKAKGPSTMEKKDLVVGNTAAVARLPNHVGQEGKDKKGTFPGSQSGSVNEEGGQIADAEKCPGIPLPTQAVADALISRTNSRAIFTGSPSTASLHS